MSREIIIVGLAGLLMCATSAHARSTRHSITTVDGKILRTNGLGPCVVKPINEECDWYMRKGGGTTEIGMIKGPGYLGYKPDGEGKGKGIVILADKSGKGTEWEVTHVRDKVENYYTIRATTGKVKGWYLTADEKGEDFTDGTGKKVKTYRVYLSEKPTKHSRWDFTEISP